MLKYTPARLADKGSLRQMLREARALVALLEDGPSLLRIMYDRHAISPSPDSPAPAEVLVEFAWSSNGLVAIAVEAPAVVDIERLVE